MGRKRIHQSDTERAKIDGVEMLKLKQFSMTLENVFTLNDLRELWSCTGS